MKNVGRVPLNAPKIAGYSGNSPYTHIEQPMPPASAGAGFANKGRRMNANWYLKEIQRLVFLHNIVYLKESTALGELPAWKI